MSNYLSYTDDRFCLNELMINNKENFFLLTDHGKYV